MIMPTKPEQEKKINITLSLDHEIVQRLDAMATRIGFSRSHAARNLLITGLELMEDFEKFRIVSFAVFITEKVPNVKNAFKKWVLDLENTFKK